MENNDYTNGFEKGYIKGFQKGRDSVVKEKLNYFNETQAVLRMVVDDIGIERGRFFFRNIPGRTDYELGLDKARAIIEKYIK